MRTLVTGLVLGLVLTATARGQYQTLQQAERLKAAAGQGGRQQSGDPAADQRAADQKAADEARQGGAGANASKKPTVGSAPHEFKIGKNTFTWRFVEIRNDQALMLDDANGGRPRWVPMMA